ncbi:nucleotidyltransferase domain-containing protein [Vibrio sp. PP-XX7]
MIGKTASKREFKIHKIILFGSHAKGGWVSDIPNGYVSDYDILVIVNMPSLVDEDVVWRRAEEQIERKVKSAPLGLIVHTLKDVNEQLQKGHYFFTDIRAEGILLFDANKRELAEPGDLTETERREIAQGHFDHWFKSVHRAFIHVYAIYQSEEVIYLLPRFNSIKPLNASSPVRCSPSPTTCRKPTISKN